MTQTIARENLQLKYETGCPLSVSCRLRTAPMPCSDASVLTIKDFLKCGLCNTGRLQGISTRQYLVLSYMSNWIMGQQSQHSLE